MGNIPSYGDLANQRAGFRVHSSLVPFIRILRILLDFAGRMLASCLFNLLHCPNLCEA